MSPGLQGFALDRRSLALGRILLGFIVLVEFGFALARRDQYYSESGVLPRAGLAYLWGMKGDFSIFLLGGWPGFTVVFLAVGMIASVAMMLGWRTRYASVAVWFLLYSLQNRNPLILIGGDSWLRATLFWFMFLPLDDFFSVEARGRGEQTRPTVVANAASAGLVLQASFVYLWAGVAKNGLDWWEGTAIGYVMRGEEFGYGLSHYLLYFPKFLALMTIAIPWLEVVAALALITPVRAQYCRLFAISSLLLMHSGIQTTMRLYHFSAVAAATLIALAPSLCWRWQGSSSLPPPDSPPMPSWLSRCLWILSLATLLYNPYRLAVGDDKVAEPVRSASQLLGLYQIWGLFSPVAPKESVVVFAVAGLSDGTRQQLGFWGEKVTAPPRLGDPGTQVRLSRYWRSLLEGSDPPRRLRTYAEYFWRRWSLLYPAEASRLATIELYYQRYPTSSDYEDLPPDAPIMMLRYPR